MSTNQERVAMITGGNSEIGFATVKKTGSDDRPTLAQAGGKNASKLDEALESVVGWLEEKLK